MSEHQVKQIEEGLMFERSFNKLFGLSMYSDDFACKLLAFCYTFGGLMEAVVVHPGLNFAIRCSQEKLNIKGGEIPNAELMPLLHQYINEICDNGSKTPWLKEIADRYKLTIPEVKDFQEMKKIIATK